MNASCLDEKGRFKSCPYRVYTDEHMLVAFLLENEKARLSEKD